MNKNNYKYLFSILILLFILLPIIIFLANRSADENPIPSDSSQTTEIQETTSVPETDSDTPTLTAQDIIDDISVGWNLGNALDSCTDGSNRNDGTYATNFYETAWGNPVTTKELIDTVASSGFNAIRIPITWFYNTYEKDGHLYIREEWLKRVAEVVQYALDNNMYVIINSHHDAPILWADMTDIITVSKNAKDLWKQVAEYFKDYDYNLLFESYNELNTQNDSWKYSDGASHATNILNQIFVDTVRKTGGNNTDRVLICNTYLNGTSDEIFNSFVLPSDSVKNKLIIGVHSYSSYYNQDISELFLQLDQFSKDQNAPILISEFGTTTNFVPSEYRAQHAGNYIARAAQYGIKCFWWDNGLEYKLFNRTDYSVTQANIVHALMHPCIFSTNDIATYHFDNIDDYSYSMLQSDNGSLSEFSQGALTLDINNLGQHVTPYHGYRLTLRMKEDGTGIRIAGIAFYNQNQEFISFADVNEQTYYDVTAPEDSAYMKVSLYNPWGYRSKQHYKNYLEKGDLYLEIVEYKKS